MIRALLADADLNRAIVHGLIRRNSDIDFQTSNDVPLDSLPDLEVISLAGRLNRVLVSHDVNTMPRHFRNLYVANEAPELVLIPQNLAMGVAIERLSLIVEACVPEDLENRICLIPSLTIYEVSD